MKGRKLPRSRVVAPLTPEWRRWLIENLLLGVEPRKLVVPLAKAGLSAARAQAAIETEIENPCFRGSYRAACAQRKLEGLVEAYSRLQRKAPDGDRIERGDGRTADIQRALSLQSHPLIIRDALPALAARGFSLGNPRLFRGARKTNAKLQPARTDMLVCQLLGQQQLQIVPWYEFVAVADARGGADGSSGRDLYVLDVSVEANEALLLPVGWWYRFLDRDGGVSVTFDIDARDRGVTWRKARLIRATSRPPPLTPSRIRSRR